jgi:hypothetical protein
MKKLVFILAVVFAGLLSCFACSTGGQRMPSFIFNGMELFIEPGEHWFE